MSLDSLLQFLFFARNNASERIFLIVLPSSPLRRTGGFNGSIRFAEELARPENEGLAPIVAELLECQAQAPPSGKSQT